MASLDELKAKYNAVINKGHEVGLSVQNLNQEGDKLLIRGVVPSDYARTSSGMKSKIDSSLAKSLQT
jgi:hypothetical protein